MTAELERPQPLDDRLPVLRSVPALVLPPAGAAYYLWLWFRRGTLRPPGRYRIGFRHVWLDSKKRLPHERATAYADLADRRAA